MKNYFNEYISQYIPWATISTLFTLAIFFCALGCMCWVANFIIKRYLIKIAQRLINTINPAWGELIFEHKLIQKFARIWPVLLFYASSKLLQFEQATTLVAKISQVIEIFCLGYVVILFAVFLNALLNGIQEIYKLYAISIRLPIKSYLEILKFLVVLFTLIILASILLDVSYKVFFTGLGAATAIIGLIFKDSLLGFVASIQLSLYDIVRIGDWITAPAYNVDGNVEDVSLSMVKVRNFDKTISTIPTHALLTTGLQNWRAMEESGGRRIKRSIKLDVNYIRFYSLVEAVNMKSRFPLLANYIEQKLSESQSNIQNQSSLSNSDLFREYISAYLKGHPKIHQKRGFTFLVRYLESTEKGLPIEIYVFTKVTNWVAYEQIQAEIFDHFLAIASQFDLKIFQDPRSFSEENGRMLGFGTKTSKNIEAETGCLTD